MRVVLKISWIISVCVLIPALLWFLIGTTAFFQRGVDLVGTVIFTFMWAPALLLTITLIVWLKKGWMPQNLYMQIGLAIAAILVSVLLARQLFQRTDTVGWLTERVIPNDHPQVTTDGKYEYELEVINPFQGNSSARLCVKDLLTNEEWKIPVEISTKGVGALSSDLFPWVELQLLDEDNCYLLVTTRHLKEPTEKYEIDMEARTSRRIE